MIQTFHSEVTKFNIHVKICWTSLIREMQIITNTRYFTPTKLEKLEPTTVLSKWKCGAVGTLKNNIQKCKSVQSFCHLKSFCWKQELWMWNKLAYSSNKYLPNAHIQKLLEFKKKISSWTKELRIQWVRQSKITQINIKL